MNKVTLPKEVAEAIDGLLRLGRSKRDIISASTGGIVGERSAQIKMFVDDSPENFEVLMSALVNGYEVEQTPEEKVREYYDFLRSASTWNEDHAGKVRAIEKTLDLLGIKISGVNAE
jgi:hypothetical protein